MKSSISADDYSDLLQGINDKHMAGYFSWANPRWHNTAVGGEVLGCLLFGCDKETLESMCREDTMGVQAVIRLVLKEAGNISDEKMEEIDKRIAEENEKNGVLVKNVDVPD